MIYIVLASVVATIAAATIENTLKPARVPVRLFWVAAICFPVVAALSSARLVRSAPVTVLSSSDLSRGRILLDRSRGFPTRFALPPFSIAVSADSQLVMLDSTLIALWMAGCILTLGVFGGAVVRLRRIRSAGEDRDIGGVRVSVTPSTGPLVVGVVHPRILVPRWVLDLDPSERQLVIAHEQEHLRARDPALLALGALAAVITPWNPFLWYMLRRLGQAVELDCDHRVLVERPDVRAYAGLLLSVASRRQTNLLPLAGLAASTSSLEQRLRLMTRNPAPSRGYRLISALGVVALLLAATVIIPRPIRGAQRNTSQTRTLARGGVDVVSAPKASTHKVNATGGSFSDAANSSQFTAPDTTAFFEFQVDTPVVLRESIKPQYPAELKSSGISGEVLAEFVVDETGRVDMKTFKSLKSSDPQFTAAVRAVLPKWRLYPAIRHGEKVKQVVQQAFEFGLPPHA
jgi:TonB family protein